MNRTRHSQAYEALAVQAGHIAGLNDPAPKMPETVAADPEARAVRDGLWAEYERLLRDEQTYTLNAIHKWLAGQGVTIGRASVHRDRRALLAREQSIVLAARRAKAVIEAAKAAGAEEIGVANAKLASQLIFDALSSVSPTALNGLEPAVLIKLMELGGRLLKIDAEAALLRQRRCDAETLKAEVVKATQSSPDGRLSEKVIDEISTKVFGRGTIA
jgi:hypothetical protein